MTDFDPEFTTKKKYNLRKRNRRSSETQEDDSKDPVKIVFGRPPISQKKSYVKNTQEKRKPKRKPQPKTIKPKEEIAELEETESTEEEIDIEDTENESESDDQENEYDEDDSFIDNGEMNDKQLITLLTNAISKKISNSMIDEEEYSDESESESEEDERENKKPQKKDQKLYQRIKESVKKERPNVRKLLQTDVPFKEQCELFEKIKVLDNMNKYTEEYLAFKNDIRTKLDSFQNSELHKKEYSKYDKLEESLLKEKNMNMPWKYKILSSDMSWNNKKVVYEKYLVFKTLCPSDENYAKMVEWFEWAISMPTKLKQIQIKDINEDRNRFSTELRRKLDEKLYGIDNVKQKITCIVNDYLTLYNKEGVLDIDGFSGNQLALVGSPGVGKTLLIRTLAKCLDIPFQQISLGGVKDSSFLEGHLSTYIGAKPGAIVEAMRRMQFSNGIIFFDEFDKLADTSQGLEVAHSLLHIIDNSQNTEFRDKYLAEFQIDLSKIWFIYSMNDKNLVNRILLDRVKPIIEVENYKESDKIQIVKKHLLPNSLKMYGYTNEDFDIEDTTISSLINKIEKEHGVRELKQSIKEIIRKLHFLKTNVLKDGTLGELKVKFDILKKIDITKKIMITDDIIEICLQGAKKEEVPFGLYM